VGIGVFLLFLSAFFFFCPFYGATPVPFGVVWYMTLLSSVPNFETLSFITTQRSEPSPLILKSG